MKNHKRMNDNLKKLLMGNEAIAYGAIRAGVKVATGYPGTPSSEILECIQKIAPDYLYAEWSVNEKAALEVAAGAAIAGARAMVTMKQVGLNVASDPLMSLNYIGVKAGLVVIAADDPGPISSQTEQDTRRFGEFAKLAVFDPSSPKEAYIMIADAFEYSEKYGRPVLFRPTTRVCHSRDSIKTLPDLEQKPLGGFSADSGRWSIFPRLSYLNHLEIEKELAELSREFSVYPGNILTGKGTKGIACGGVSYLYVKEALNKLSPRNSTEYKLLKVSTVPFPSKLGEEFLSGLEEALVVEELDPVIEDALIHVLGTRNTGAKILGKRTGHIPNAGENSPNDVYQSIAEFLGFESESLESEINRHINLSIPIRPPVLCPGCPHRGSFLAVKEATKGKKAVFSSDIGCYTLGNASPFNMADTCLCMGAGITMAQGLNLAEPDSFNFAFIGDSTFFHSGITGIINAVYNGANIIVCILDNRTTAMTGGQPHPGVGFTLMNKPAAKLDIYKIVRAIGVTDIWRVNAFDHYKATEAVSHALEKKGVRVVIFEGACIMLRKKGS
ncbi:MAG: indolepyruvate ferredoxin oxidoreductase subunit alpha [Clostridiales bacterium]|jgi:indolepyruvate ferredoxin oxidoreductase alpha subunit|nr:indolepyruvate ferredoxin oxidoreductase subunit alpha [Clostridiales bacterium]